MASRTAKKGMKKPKGQEYNAQGSKEMAAADDESPEFKKGGIAKKKRDHEKLKHGGYAEGGKPKMRADKKPRGMHHKRAAGGRSPYTSGHHTTMPSEAGATNSGHEGQRPSEGD